MNRYKGKIETAKRGFLPGIFDYEGYYVDFVLDNAYVEYGTGCWISTVELDEDVQFAQQEMYRIFKGHLDMDTEREVWNTCHDYRICYNPACLEIADEA
jgi:hypothetical protein